MDKFKLLIITTCVLVSDILQLGYKVISKIILPARNRKGNVLSCVFEFFTLLVERLIRFQQGIFTFELPYISKYVRSGLLIAAWLLCLLSTYEWSGYKKEQPDTNNKDFVSSAKLTSCQTAIETIRSNYTATLSSFLDFISHNRKSFTLRFLYLTKQGPCPLVKRYLYIRNLRI